MVPRLCRNTVTVLLGSRSDVKLISCGKIIQTVKLLKKGAEGDIFVTRYEGMPAILKTRKKKSYRNPELDEKIRKQRTIREAGVISEARSFGVLTPLIYQVDTARCTILMQYIPGAMVRDLAGKKLESSCVQIGKMTGTLHKNGIMHGDLTTSNFILNQNKVFAIDFGLSQRTPRLEDHAVDLRLFKEILGSEHVESMGTLWSRFLQGYKSAVGQVRFNKILHHVSVIEARGRYAEVV